MNEAMRCDRISLMNAGRVLVSDTPANVIKKRGSATLEEAFISYLEEDQKAREKTLPAAPPPAPAARGSGPRTFSHCRQSPVAEPGPSVQLREP